MMGAHAMDAPQEIVVGARGGEAITDRDRRQVVMLTSQPQITITYYRIADGERGPDPHVHREHMDSFYVLEGELDFELGPDRERVRVGAGGLAAAPPNVVHTFANESGAEVRFLNLHTPDGGFGAYMRAARDGDATVTFDTFDPPADGGLPLSEAIVSGPGDGERLVSGNRVALLKGAAPQMSFAEFEYDGPFAGPDLHRHRDDVDSFYLLAGELEITVEETQSAAGPGTLASVPPGVAHTFAHPGAGRVRFLNIHAPEAGFADFLRRVSD